jgi:Co/Zn/Cd efflux system component
MYLPEKKLLTIVLFINLAFFLIEIVAGFLSGSMGLTADSLDMLADAFVYGLSLYVSGKSLLLKKRVALTSGYSQLILAAIGITEVVRRFINPAVVPDFSTMIIISIFALAANSVSLYLLMKHKNKEAHIKASTICTSNDVIVNAGVILAGILVFLTGSNKPDLLIGIAVFYYVVRGAVEIIKLGNRSTIIHES